MAHGDDEEGDYWPGYVDALTSMVQVLAFVMMLLAMAVFVLSQNVSKSAVEAIAKAANIDVPPDANVTQITEKVMEEIKKAQAGAGEKQQQAKGTSDTASPDAPKTAPPPPSESSADPAPDSTAIKAPVSQRIEGKPKPPEKPAEPAPNAQRAVLHFAKHSFKVEAYDSTVVADFIAKNNPAASKTKLIVRAFASSVDVALSESRRIAYYRAMTLKIFGSTSMTPRIPIWGTSPTSLRM